MERYFNTQGVCYPGEPEHHTGMDRKEMAGILYDYTSGYPFLVSRLCQLMDEKSLGQKISLIGMQCGRTAAFWKRKTLNFGEIISLYFLPDYMGKGYGRLLLQAVAGELKKMGRLHYKRNGND